MATEPELHNIKKNATAVRNLSRRLIAYEDDLTEFEESFLRGKADWPDDLPLSHRQAEVLLEIRDNHELVSQYRGFSVPRLVEACRLRSSELANERDAEFIDELHGRTSVPRRLIWRLARCSRELEVIEDYM